LTKHETESPTKENVMTTRDGMRWLGTLTLGMMLGLAPMATAAQAADNGSAAARHEPREALPPPVTGTPEQANEQTLRYAAREAETPQLATFEGGSAGVYIGGSTLAVVLIVVLIVVLL
jgi:hypothetical protein